ncbi:MAG: hypothetical protein NC124_09930 [Clostridium sp.]|nr:hypothetical protein [Clostridium sp.]
MYKIKQVIYAALANFRRWKRSPQVVLCFMLAFIFCFLLSDKVMQFAKLHDTYLQMLETFIWTFGDAQSVLIISLLLLLLFSDMPNLSNEVPLFMVRMDRTIWLLGQLVYLVSASFVFICFILVSTVLLSLERIYPADMWSETAAILAYSNIGEALAVPAFIKVLELTFPYACSAHIFLLMTGYAVSMASVILFFNLCKANGGMIGGIVFSGFGLLMNPDLIARWFHISTDRMQYANILFGWLSPLNHATYYMHNFGYDNLPRLWTSYVFFAVFSLVFFVLSLLKIKNYAFCFTGTQR